MATEVFHGPNPKWKPKLQPGVYGCEIGGRYTITPGLTVAGVKAVRWNSKRPAKRQAELLGMRTAFVCWFVATYIDLGGTQKDAIRAIQKYPFQRILKKLRAKQRGMRYLG